MTHTLTIEQGLSAGAVCALGPDWLVVGTGPLSDIRLFDDGVAGAHLALRGEGRRIAIRAGAEAADGVTIEGRGTLPPGQTIRLGLPLRLGVGPVVLRIDREVPLSRGPGPATVAETMLRRVAPLPLAAAFFLGTANPTFTAITPAPALPAAALPPAPAQSAEGPPDGDAAAGALGARLADAGFRDVSVAWEDTTLRVSGMVEAARRGALAELLRAFDADHAGRLVIRNDASADPAAGRLPATPRIGAVWHGADPYVTVGGERYGLHASLPGGWEVVEIDRGGVVLAHGDRRVAVAFR